MSRDFYKENNIYTLKKDNKNFINFCPDRGGLITEWVCESESILYFDKTRFLDKKKSIRGGIPVLFPICGSLNLSNSIFGKDFELMPQHGFARDLKWLFEINSQSNSLNLFLVNNKTTKKYYPFEFEVEMHLMLGINNLSFEIIIQNKSNKYMPVNFGLHPYFNISNFHNISFLDYPLVCQNQKNNNLEKVEELLKNLDQGIDLLMYSSGESSFRDYGLNREIKVTHSFPFDLCVIWSDPTRNMVCLEPWTSPRNSLKEGFRRIEIPPNSYQKLFMSINIEKFY